MELYIEKAFIDNFFIELDLDNPHQTEQVLINIFEKYGDVDSYMDVSYNTPIELENLKLSNPFIANLFNTKGPVSVTNIKDHFFSNSKCEQTLIFTQNEEEWFIDAESKGALCFSFDNFRNKIKNIIDDIIELNIDIVDMPYGWGKFKCLANMPFNSVLICDHYILSNKSNQRMDQNIIPMLKAVLAGKEKQSIPIQILSSDFNPPQPKTAEQINDAVLQKHRMLKTAFGKFKAKFTIVSTLNTGQFDLHGRELINNFVLIRSGKGFNLMPARQRSNEVLTAGTIFNKSDYKRLKSRLKLYNEFTSYLMRLETSNFKIYPT